MDRELATQPVPPRVQQLRIALQTLRNQWDGQPPPQLTEAAIRLSDVAPPYPPLDPDSRTDQPISVTGVLELLDQAIDASSDTQEAIRLGMVGELIRQCEPGQEGRSA